MDRNVQEYLLLPYLNAGWRLETGGWILKDGVSDDQDWYVERLLDGEQGGGQEEENEQLW